MIPAATVYYVTTPAWVRKLRGVCEWIIAWSRRFDVYTRAGDATNVTGGVGNGNL